MGGSESTQEVINETTNVSTTATAIQGFAFANQGDVTIRDIGLTGKNAVGLATVLGQTAIEQQKIVAQQLDRVIQASTFRAISGGAGGITAAVPADAPPKTNMNNIILLLGGAAAVATVFALNN